MAANPYSAKLAEYSGLAFQSSEGFKNQGSWCTFFLDKLQSKVASKQSSKLVLEIGCSSGLFLNSIAEANPDVFFIGMDWKYKAIYKAAEKTSKQHLKNIAFLRNKAQEIGELFGDKELDEAWIFFPDPWAKASQKKHRVLNPDFFKLLYSLLKDRGRLYFKTDHPGYFQWVMAHFGVAVSDNDLHMAYNSPTTVEKNKRGRQIQVRRTEDCSEIRPDANLLQLFKVTQLSLNYWQDSSEKGAQTLFAGKTTLFERLFIKDNLPIHFVCFEKKS